MFTTSPSSVVTRNFPAVGDVPRLLQLSCVIRKITTGCSQVLVHKNLVTSTCVVVLQLEHSAVYVISHLLTGESGDDGPMPRCAVPDHIWCKTVPCLDLISMHMHIRAHFCVEYCE